MAHIHLSDGFNPEFQGALPTDPFVQMAVELCSYATVSHGGEAPDETTILVAGRLQEGEKSLPNLHTVVVPFAGIPAALATALSERPEIKVVNLHFNASATAEMAMALLLGAARGVPQADAALRKGYWRGRQDSVTGVLLAGKTATVLGYGEVGRRVGVACKALGMDVIGVRRTFDAAEPEVLGVDRLHDALSQSHALIVTAPGTPETEGLIGTREIGLLKKPRLIVNVGRGAVIHEEALYDACRDGEVAGAGLDVWYQYPKGDNDGPNFPSMYPFHELDNVTMSPHRAGTGDDTERLRTADLLRVLRQILSGEPVRYVDLGNRY
ncbi:MAG: hypothetical protein KF784_09480 [Fimbriimonadaceae bacterium]|nr:hypothetical protein [Fimbriimonadaceae bacterium]